MRTGTGGCCEPTDRGPRPARRWGIAAAVARGGSADRLCLTRSDGAACFAAPLGGPEHGRRRLAPAADPAPQVSRRCRGGARVLETDQDARAKRRRAHGVRGRGLRRRPGERDPGRRDGRQHAIPVRRAARFPVLPDGPAGRPAQRLPGQQASWQTTDGRHCPTRRRHPRRPGRCAAAPVGLALASTWSARSAGAGWRRRACRRLPCPGEIPRTPRATSRPYASGRTGSGNPGLDQRGRPRGGAPTQPATGREPSCCAVRPLSPRSAGPQKKEADQCRSQKSPTVSSRQPRPRSGRATWTLLAPLRAARPITPSPLGTRRPPPPSRRRARRPSRPRTMATGSIGSAATPAGMPAARRTDHRRDCAGSVRPGEWSGCLSRSGVRRF